MANQYSLQDIAIGEARIKKYIITDNEQVLANNDNTGNIIVYISDGGPFTLADFNNDEYRDLYIGDEHVAGGFGFKNIETRNKILSDVETNLPDKISDLDDRLQSLESAFVLPGETPEVDPNLKLNPLYNIIEICYGNYKLDYQNGELRVVNDVKPSIYDTEITFDNFTTIKEGDTYAHNYYESFKLYKISFIYEGTEELDSLYISYKNTADDGYDTDFVGSYSDPLKLNFNKYDWSDTEYLKYISNKYFLRNPNKYPNTVQQLIEITFDTENPILKDAEGKYEFRIALIDKANRKVVKTIFYSNIITPIYYGVSTINPGSYDDINGIFGVKLIDNFEDQYDITFAHATDEESYAWIFVPERLLNTSINNDPLIWYNEDIVLRTKWHRESTNIPWPGNNKEYRLYRSPNRYKKIVNWKIKLER